MYINIIYIVYIYYIYIITLHKPSLKPYHGYSFEEGGRGGGRGYMNEEMQKDLIDNLMRGTKKDDMFQMALNRDRTLSMRHNGKQMVNIFHGITGPLYLCASMYYDNSEVEIVEVIDTTQDEE